MRSRPGACSLSGSVTAPISPAARAKLRALAASLPSLASVDELDALYALLEERLLREALESQGWRLRAAGRRVGRPGTSSLTRRLDRHPDLAAELARQQAATRCTA